MTTAKFRRITHAFPQATLTQRHGLTEVGLPVFLLDRWHHGPHAQQTAAGQAAPVYQAKVVDAEGRELPHEREDEAAFTGVGAMQGYLNMSDETSKSLHDGVLFSDDAGVMDASDVITLLARVNDLTIAVEEIVYAVEVENAVAQQPAVAQCAVMGGPHPTYGEGVHAAVVLKSGQTLALEELRSPCATHIASYKCPVSLDIRDALPMSAMGKILQSNLRTPHWTGQTRQVN